MNDDTIVAVYDTAARAELAVRDLREAGIPDAAINVHAADVAGAPDARRLEPRREAGFWSNLFGGEPDHDPALYERSVASGSTVVTVQAPQGHTERVMEILESHAPVDLDQRAAEYGLTGPRDASPGRDDETLRLAEERLEVGKRLVNRGGTRIRRFVVETPVERQVTLRDEAVTLERRPVTETRAADPAAFTDKTLEMTETSEEAVVSKRAYVTEEVALRKQSTDRVETVRDSVRREDVAIEKIPGTPNAGDATGPSVIDPRPLNR